MFLPSLQKAITARCTSRVMMTLLIGCLASLMAAPANGDTTITDMSYTPADVAYNHSDADFTATFDIDAMMTSAWGGSLNVTLSRYVLGVNTTNTTAVKKNKILFKCSSASTLPLHLTLSNWVFLQNGTLEFAGQFPPGSTVSLSQFTTVRNISNSPILIQDLILSTSSSFTVSGFSCNTTLPCLQMTNLTLHRSSFLATGIVSQLNEGMRSIHSVNVDMLVADDRSTFTVTNSSTELLSQTTFHYYYGLLRIANARLSKYTTISFTKNRIVTSFTVDTSQIYLLHFIDNGMLDMKDSELVVEDNFARETILEFRQSHAIYIGSSSSSASTNLTLENSRFSVRRNTGIVAMALYSWYDSSVKSNTFDISENSGPLFNVGIGMAVDNMTLNIVDNFVNRAEYTTFITSFSTISLYLGGQIVGSHVNILGNNFYTPTSISRTNLDIQLDVLLRSTFTMANNVFNGDETTIVESGTRDIYFEGMNQSNVLITNNTFGNFMNLPIMVGSAPITNHSLFHISGNRLTGHLAVDNYISSLSTGSAAIQIKTDGGDRLSLHDHSVINVSHNSILYNTAKSLYLHGRYGISTCIKPIVTHFSSVVISANSVMLDTTVSPASNTYGIDVESCGDAGGGGSGGGGVLIGARRLKTQGTTSLDAFIALVMDDFSAQVNPEMLASRCAAPINYTDFELNPGVPITQYDLPPEGDMWGVILLAASSMVVDDNVVDIQGHGYNDWSQMDDPYVTALVLPATIRITQGSTTTSSRNYIVANITKYADFSPDDIPYTIVGMSPSNPWISDVRSSYAMTNNNITVSSPFTTLGMFTMLETPSFEPPSSTGHAVRSRRMSVADVTPTNGEETHYPEVLLQSFDDWDQGRTTTSSIVVGCSSTFRIDRNLMSVSGIAGTGGIILRPSKASISTAGILSLSDNIIVPVWINVIPDLIEASIAASVFDRDFIMASLSASWFSVGIVFGGNQDFIDAADSSYSDSSRAMLPLAMDGDDMMTTKGLYNAIVNISNNRVHLSRLTEPISSGPGSESGILCVGDIWIRNSSRFLVELNDIQMENDIITDISKYASGEVPASMSYGIALRGNTKDESIDDIIFTLKRKMEVAALTPTEVCIADYASSTVGQMSVLSVNGNRIRGSISVDLNMKGARSMINVTFPKSILVYGGSRFSIDNNVATNDGGSFASLVQFVETEGQDIASCGNSITSISNNTLMSAPLHSDPSAQSECWALTLEISTAILAYNSHLYINNNNFTFAYVGGVGSAAGVEVGNGIGIYVESADIGGGSLMTIDYNTIVLGDNPWLQTGIHAFVSFYGLLPSNGSTVRITNNNISLGCTKCRGIGINLDCDPSGLWYPDEWDILGNTLDIRAPQDPTGISDSKLTYGTPIVFLPSLLKRSFYTRGTDDSNGHLIYFDKGSSDFEVGVPLLNVRINQNTISTTMGASDDFNTVSGIFLNTLVPSGRYQIDMNRISLSLSGVSTVVGIYVVGPSGPLGTTAGGYVSNFTDISISQNTVNVSNGQQFTIGIILPSNPSQSLILANSSVSVTGNVATVSCISATTSCNILHFHTNLTLTDSSTLDISRNSFAMTDTDIAAGETSTIQGDYMTLDRSLFTLDYNDFTFSPNASIVMKSSPHPYVYDAELGMYRNVESPYASAICNTLQGTTIVNYNTTSGFSDAMVFNRTSACPTATPTKTPTLELPTTTTTTTATTTTNTTTMATTSTTNATMTSTAATATTSTAPTATTSTAPTATTSTAPTTTTSTAPTATTSTAPTATTSTAPTATTSNTTVTTASTNATSIATTTTLTTTASTTSTTPPTTTATTTPTTTTTTAPATCDTTLANQLADELPLHLPITVSISDIQRGLVRTVATRVTLNTSYLLLSGGTLSTTGSLQLRTLQMSVAGNVGGFASSQPIATLTFVNATAITIDISALPAYDLDEDEGLELSVETSHLVGSMCVGTQLVVGRVYVTADVQLYGAPSSVVTTIVSGGAAAAGMGGMSGMAAEQQALSALVMFGCADPHSRHAFGSFRALSPFAIFESYAGVVLGNAIVMAVVAVIQAIVLVVLRVCRRVRRQVELMATARFPALLMNVSFAFHTGTVYAASQLISQSSQYDDWEVAVGGVAFVYCVIYPIFLCAHPFYRIGRAYQEYEMSEWLAAKKLPPWIVHIVPQGAMYAPETRKAYGSYISSYRAPASEVWWTSYPTWTPILIGLGGLFHPSTVPGCQALFIVLGLLFLAVAGVCAWRAPLRSTTATYLNSFAKVVTALVLFCLAASVTGESTEAYTAVFAFGIIQIIATILRIVHSLICSYFDRKMTSDVVPLSTTWTHVLGAQKKSTTQFSSLGLDLVDEAASRDTSGDALLEMEDLEEDSGDNEKQKPKASSHDEYLTPDDANKPSSPTTEHATSKTGTSTPPPSDDDLDLDLKSSESSSSSSSIAFSQPNSGSSTSSPSSADPVSAATPPSPSSSNSISDDML